MRQDKHTIKVPAKLLNLALAASGIGGRIADVEFTIPSQRECVRKLYYLTQYHDKGRDHEIATDFHRWFTAYMLTGEDPDKVDGERLK